jgi:hypothetical protein
MPSAQDIFNELVQLGSKLDALNATSQAIKGDDDQLVALTTYADSALYQNAVQNATIICLLEQIAKNTCDLVNLSAAQTRLQESIEKNTLRLSELYAATHGDAAIILEREQHLRKEIEKCCPPAPPAPPCQQAPCKSPKQIDPPPRETNTFQ